MKEDIRVIALKYKELNEGIYMMLFSVFRDSFSWHASVTNKVSLILCAETFHSMNLVIKDKTCVCPIVLGYENKDSILTETTHVKEISTM